MAHETTNNGAHKPLRVFVFDNMRTRSHLFFRIFFEHPQLSPLYHPYLNAEILGPKQIFHDLNHSAARQKQIEEDWAPLAVSETPETVNAQWEAKIAKIEEEGKSLFSHEHGMFVFKNDLIIEHVRGKRHKVSEVLPNPTKLPDWLFETVSPVILIRHPAYSFPSIYKSMVANTGIRMGDEDFEICFPLRFTRLLFDLFRSQGRHPVVIDGDDTLWRFDEMTSNLCAALGIDHGPVKDTWEPVPPEGRDPNPIVAGFTKTLWDSTGVQRTGMRPTDPIDLKELHAKLVEELGVEVAEFLTTRIEAELPDYEYLKQFKI